MRSPELRHPWVALTALCLGMLVASLDTTIVNVTLPSLVSGLNADLDQVLWVVNGYVLVYATLLITGGRLGDVLGSRRMLLGGLLLFTVASALCGVSGTATELVLARILQGVGAAVMVPQVMTIISGIFPAERRGAAFGILSATAGVAAVSGPVLGGLILTDWSWRWVFYINVPVCAVTCALVLIFVPAPPMTRQHRFDALGIVLATAGLAAVTYGLIEGQRYDWGTITGFITIPEVIGVGVVALIAFAWWQNRHPEPLMPLTLFRYRSFSIATLINGVLYLTMYGVTLLVSLHLQSVAGLSALRTGLTYLPMAFAMGFLSVVAGRLTDRVGAKRLIVPGLTVLAIGVAVVAWAESGTATAARFLLPLLIVGIGVALVMAPSTTEALRELPQRLAGAASGVFNSSRQVAGAFGVAIVGAVLQNRMTSDISHKATDVAGRLPAPERGRFVDGLSQTVKHGGFVAPPSDRADLVQRLSHQVYADVFASAERLSLLVVAVLCLVSVVASLRLSRPAVPAQSAPQREPQVERA